MMQGSTSLPAPWLSPALSSGPGEFKSAPLKGQRTESSIAPAPPRPAPPRRPPFLAGWEEKGGEARRRLCGMRTGLGGWRLQAGARAARLAGAFPPGAPPE